MVHLSLKTRWNAVRRGLPDFRWSIGDRRPGRGRPDPALILDDGAILDRIRRDGLGPPMPFAGPRTADPDRPSGEQTAVLAILGQVRAEGEALIHPAAARGQAALLQNLSQRHGGADALAAFSSIVRDLAPAALGAALAAIRAGAAARGFASAARDSGSLAEALRRAWDGMEPLVAALEDQAAETASLVASLHGLEPLLDGGERDGDLRGPARRAAVAVARIEALREEMARTLDAVAGRLASVAAPPSSADRRAGRRFPFRSACRLLTARGAFPGRTVDVSPTGALVTVTPVPDLRRGQPVSLVLRDVGPIAGIVAGVSESGVHLAFDLGHAANAVSGRALRPVLAGLAHENAALVTRARDLAAALTEALGKETEAGRIATRAILPPDPSSPSPADLLPGENELTAFYERVLAPLLAGAVEDSGADEVAAVDRAGRPRARSLGGAGGRPDADSAAAWAREKAARNLRPSLVQVYPDRTGAPDALVRDVSAPVFVRGRHWGCARLLQRFSDPGVS